MTPQKVFFSMLLETPGPYGAKWVPEGADMPCFGRKGYQKARNITPEGSKKVVWSASLACFTVTHFSGAKAIFKKNTAVLSRSVLPFTG